MAGLGVTLSFESHVRDAIERGQVVSIRGVLRSVPPVLSVLSAATADIAGAAYAGRPLAAAATGGAHAKAARRGPDFI